MRHRKKQKRRLTDLQLAMFEKHGFEKKRTRSFCSIFLAHDQHKINVICHTEKYSEASLVIMMNSIEIFNLKFLYTSDQSSCDVTTANIRRSSSAQ
jgi:hypothetical protein